MFGLAARSQMACLIICCDNIIPSRANSRKSGFQGRSTAEVNAPRPLDVYAFEALHTRALKSLVVNLGVVAHMQEPFRGVWPQKFYS